MYMLACVYLQVLRDVVEKLGNEADVSKTADLIIKEKAIKDMHKLQFRVHLTLCLGKVAGVRQLWFKVEQLRAERYRTEDERHEALLMKVKGHH